MRLRHIEVFHAVMQASSLSGAAALLNISQPAVSKLIAAAERHLGLQLFLRTPSGLKPTQEAHLLFAQTNQVHRSLENVRRLASNLKAHPGGMLRIGCIPSLGFSIVPEAIAKFVNACPGVSLNVQTHNTEALCELLVSQDLDVGVAFDPPLRPGIRSIELGRAKAVYVAPGVNTVGNAPIQATTEAAASLRTGKSKTAPQESQAQPPCDVPISLDSLSGANWIGLDSTDPLGAKIFATLAQRGHGERVPAIEVKTYYLARALADCGVGYTIVDEFTAGAGQIGRTIRDLDPMIDVGICVLTAENSTGSRAREVLIAELQARFD